MADDVPVTVVVRTYERPELVQRAIDSVLSQTYSDYELVIVDDHSRDSTPYILSQYDEKHDKIRVVRHDKNKGPGAAFNTGKRAARGRYIAYLDDDDEWLPKKLQAQVGKLEALDSEYGLVTGGFVYKDLLTGECIDTFVPSMEGDIFWDLIEQGSGSILGPPSVIMLRKSAMDDIGEFREDMPRGCGQLYYRQLAREYKISYVEDLCLNYYIHPNRITAHTSARDYQNEIEARLIKLDEFGDAFEEVPSAYARELEYLGHYYCLSGDLSTGRQYFRRAFNADGFSGSLLLRSTSSLFGSQGYQLLKPGLDLLVRKWQSFRES